MFLVHYSWRKTLNPKKFNGLRANSHTRLRARFHYTSSTLIGEKVESVQVYFTICSRNKWSMWMQDGCKVYMDSYMTLNGSCFMVTWTIFKSHFLEVGLTQNQETMALWMFTTMCEDPHELKFIEIAYGWGPGHIWLYTGGAVTTRHGFRGVLGQPWDTLFWAITISWSRL